MNTISVKQAYRKPAYREATDYFVKAESSRLTKIRGHSLHLKHEQHLERSHRGEPNCSVIRADAMHC